MTYEELYDVVDDRHKEMLDKISLYGLRDKIMEEEELEYFDDFSFSAEMFILFEKTFSDIKDVNQLLEYARDLKCLEASKVIEKVIQLKKEEQLFNKFYSDTTLWDVMNRIKYFDKETILSW